MEMNNWKPDLEQKISDDKITIKELMYFCRDYDKYVCNDYAGKSVFCDIIERLVEQGKLSQERSDMYWDCLIEDEIYEQC